MVKKFQRHLLSFQPWSQSALITSSKCLPIHPPGPHPFLLANRRAALRSINNFNFPIPPAEKTLVWSLPLVPPLIFLFSTAFPCRLSHREKEHSKIGKNHPFYSQGSPPPQFQVNYSRFDLFRLASSICSSARPPPRSLSLVSLLARPVSVCRLC